MSLTYFAIAAVLASAVTSVFAQEAPGAAPYKVLKITKVGGEGNYDYVSADKEARRLYIPRRGAQPRITVLNLDTLEQVGEIAKTDARGVAIDLKNGHAFSSSKPVAMWDTKTLAVVKTIDVQGSPDSILFDTFNERLWVFSHSQPNATVIDGKEGTVLGTIDLGGEPEQAVTDEKGHVYVALEDKDKVAVLDAAAMKVIGSYGLGPKAAGPAGLAIDLKNHVLFAACHEPATMVMLDAETGTVLAKLPIGDDSDNAAFNSETMEAFSSNADGTLTVIQENSPTSFEVKQNLKTMKGAKTMAMDGTSQHLMLIAARYGAAPKSGKAKTRPAMIRGSFSVITVGK